MTSLSYLDSPESTGQVYEGHGRGRGRTYQLGSATESQEFTGTYNLLAVEWWTIVL